MKNFFLNYLYTGGAAIVFFALALFDLIHRETDPRNQWNQSWQLLSVFGKVDIILCVALFVWTIGVRLIRSKWN